MFLVDIDEDGLASRRGRSRGSTASRSSAAAATWPSRAKFRRRSPKSSPWNGVDILVNNAGITYYGKTDEMAADHWDRLMRINLLSHIQFTRELLPSLLRAPRSTRAECLQRARAVRHAEGDGVLHVEIWDGRLQRIAAERTWPRRPGRNGALPRLRTDESVHVGAARRDAKGSTRCRRSFSKRRSGWPRPRCGRFAAIAGWSWSSRLPGSLHAKRITPWAARLLLPPGTAEAGGAEDGTPRGGAGSCNGLRS